MGNANVQSDSITITDSDWESGWIYFQPSPNTTVSRRALVDTLDVPALTDEIESSGLVQVYFKTREGAQSDAWSALPWSKLSFSGEFTYNLEYTYDTGTITLYYYYERNSSGVTAPDVTNATLPDYRFKWVVASEDAASSMSSAGISIEDHDAVAQFLDQRLNGEPVR